MCIGEMLVEARQEALEITGANDMQSKHARNAISRILRREKLGEIDKAVRSDLLCLMDHREQVSAWRATLTPMEQIKWNNPRIVYRKFKETVLPPVEREPKPVIFRLSLNAAERQALYRALFHPAHAMDAVLAGIRSKLHAEGAP